MADMFASLPQLVPIVPVPEDAPACTWRHPRHGEPVAMWPYHDARGRLVAYAARVEYGGLDGRREKEVLPITYCRIGHAGGRERQTWRACGVPAPLPLYRLAELLTNPTARVIVCEGEKKADAVAVLFPGHVGTTSMGGANAARHSDWSPLAGRTVIIWPDHDAPGSRYSVDVAALATAAGATSVAIVAVPVEWPEGWDIADPLPEGAVPDVLAGLLQSALQWTPPAPNTSSLDVGDAAEFARLAALSPLQYDRERKEAAKRLGCRPSTLDRQVARQRGEPIGATRQGRPVVIDDVEPWPEPVNGAAMLDEFIRMLQQYVVISQRQADATALWVLHTHAGAAFDVAPYLWLRSAERRSGKTRFVGILRRIVCRPLVVSGINAAALLRLIELHAPTVLLDELDTLFKGDRELAEAVRGILNSGFDRAEAVFIKNVPTKDGGWAPCAFSTYGPKVLSGIGEVPATVSDRSMRIDMMRKRRDQKVRRLRARDGGEFHEIACKMARWAGDKMTALGDADPAVPEELNDRAADAWAPLLAIADAIGGDWPRRGREAAIELSGEETGTQSLGEQLLADIRDAFAERNADRLSSDELVAYLVALEGRPWAELGKSRKPLTKNGLAALLRPFKIHPGSVRLDDRRTPKGYYRKQFEDAFSRYLPTFQNATTPQAKELAAFGDFRNATSGDGVAFQNRENPSVSASCGVVALPDSGHEDAEFGERAAIIEYDGGYSRAEAERRARAELTGRREKGWLQ
jgi:putative DNA primase/helicase